MESSNAWERAQEAITRAAERSDDVVTPDNAVSPFDASMTTLIPHADVVRRGPPDADTTQRLHYGPPPAPRQAGNGYGGNGYGGNGYGYGNGYAGGGYGDGRHREPPPRTPELSDPAMPRVAPAHPGTAPFPAAGSGHHGHVGADQDDGTPPQGFSAPEPERRPWWKRLFGR